MNRLILLLRWLRTVSLFDYLVEATLGKQGFPLALMLTVGFIFNAMLSVWHLYLMFFAQAHGSLTENIFMVIAYICTFVLSVAVLGKSALSLYKDFFAEEDFPKD